MWSGRRGTPRRVPAAIASVVVVTIGSMGGATIAAGSTVAPAPTPTTTTTSTTSTTSTTLPAPATVSLSFTDGQPAQTLLGKALNLIAVGVDSSAVRAAVAATQQQLDQDAVAARQLRQAAAQATQRATTLQAQAQQANTSYHSLDSAVKQAVLFLYMHGPSAITVNPSAGSALAYALDYADTAITPNGILAARSFDVRKEQQALDAANKAAASAKRAIAGADAAVSAETQEEQRLVAELTAISAESAATANQVAADHASLATQAGAELLSTTSLQFNPTGALPSPLATTGVALQWAFAELGKPYVWGATGPNSFDCSGLTQFVWRQAGVSIPRVAADQYQWTIPVPLSQLLPGDLVFYGKTDIHHVGIYIGDGLMINAPYTGTVVQVSSIWWSDLAGFGRVHAAGTPVPLHLPPSPAQPAPPVVVATAGPVPSQTTPPPGWTPTPGSSTPFTVYPGPTTPAPTTTTTTVPPRTPTTTTVAPTTTTTTPPSTTSTSTSTTSTSTSTTTSTTSTSLPGGSQSP